MTDNSLESGKMVFDWQITENQRSERIYLSTDRAQSLWNQDRLPWPGFDSLSLEWLADFWAAAEFDFSVSV